MDIVLKGLQGKTLLVSGDSARIEKVGWLGGKREKTLPIRSITSVEVKRPGAFSGFIQFSIAGGKALDSTYTLTGGAFDAAKDENSVVFVGTENYEIALTIKSYVETWASKHETRSALSGPPVAEEIRQLKTLLDEGLLTADEFAQKKKQILGL